ncbi:MAG: hypothetical protein Metus_1592 [Candidatus Methanosuratincola subterraneus]|jgi:predicted nucleic acid-binding Zn finger protein|uniref:SWIM-type domain-containing protein n=1 Tax=Methanosuratincola subterraneus TaxID=2593994 RepID=A0A444L585_METS7|nr:MAG: hypothetical protein Metus_1592 [Candidatus Methanosuratincola subterraneus]
MEELDRAFLEKLLGTKDQDVLEGYKPKIVKAIEAVENYAVKRYRFKPSMRTVWIVVGKEREYHVIPGLYCQCDDFYINVVIKKKARACYHMIAQALAEERGIFESYELLDSDFIRLNKEWKGQTL